jgi:hypothetical protein
LSFEKNNYYTKSYNPPRKFPALRKPILLIFVITLFCLCLDLFAGTKFFAGEGPLSSAHSLMNGECKNCHTQNWTRSNATMEQQCTQCHQDNKPLKFHIAAYNLPREKKRVVRQTFCIDCHREHRGQELSPENVSNQRCRNCHDIHDASSGHPEFKPEKLETNQMESIGLRFSHLSHQKNDKNSEKVNQKFEKSCFLCHQLDPDQGFQDFKPTRFEKNCKDCHDHQELMLTWMFDKDQLPEISKSIQDLVQVFGLESYDSFLSRFEYRKPNKRRRRPASFKYVPVHQDQYLKFWFSSGAEETGDRVKAMLSMGKKGTTLNCLKCHVLDENGSKDKDLFLLTDNISIGKVMEKTKGPPPAKFFHKKHASQRCDTCHKNIPLSESLTDTNIQVTKASCFSCHNKQAVSDKCTNCHSFHQFGDQNTLTEIFATRNDKSHFPPNTNHSSGRNPNG